jgi:hypothetical protein
VTGLGHADAQTVIDGYLYALNSWPDLGATKKLYKIDTSTLSIVDTIDFICPHFAKLAYDEKTNLICVIWCGWYQGTGETDDLLHFDFYNKSLVKIKSVTAKPPRIYDIVQNACAYDGVIYIAECLQNQSEKSLIHCYDFVGNYLRTITISCGAEIEGIDVDATGYIYSSYNQYCTYGTTYLAACECPLNGNFEDKLRTPVDISYIQNSSVAKDISVYINSPTGTVRDFGIGKGTENNPYTSVAAACLAVQHIAKANSSVPIKMIFMHTSQVNIMDGILKLIGITNPLELSHYTYNTMAAANDGPGILFSSIIEGCSDVTIKFIKFYRATTNKVLTITSSNVRLDGAVFTIDATYPSYEGLLIKRSHVSLVNLIINNGVWRIDFSTIMVYPYATITENNNTRDFMVNANIFSKTI